MWKLLVGFIIFAAVAVFVLMKGGANVDMGGEKHGIETSEPAHESASAGASEAAPAASAASEAASAASQ
jgi:hypothetical protein